MIELHGLDTAQHHPVIEEITEVLCNKTQNTDKGFFRTEVAYFLGKMASSQRAFISTKDRGEIPVNIFALALATSGFGKGYSVAIMEGEFLKGFRKRFLEDTMPTIAEKHLWEIANERCAKHGGDQQEEFEKIEKEYKKAGAYLFTFDSGTTPALKQMRQKLLLADCGAINLQVDEIGSNLEASNELLTVGLELYDQGIVKSKLVKNTTDNERGEDMDGKTPMNMLLFGTPNKLLDGSATEDRFYSMLDTGYARRSIFGFGQHDKKALNSMSAKEIFLRLSNPDNNNAILKWSKKFKDLADPGKYGWKLEVDDEVSIRLLEYKIACEKAADLLPDHDEMRKAELSHRYAKALKLAGAYAFVDESSEVEMEHLMSAILLVEESGAAFQTILNREKAYVKLAKYIVDIGVPVTHADLHEALPFYKTGQAARNEQINMATAWAYGKHMIVKKSFIDGIEFFEGEKLQETNLDEMIVSYSDHFAYNYSNETAPFDHLHVLMVEGGADMSWANHHFRNGHRAEENVQPGFNMITIDCDGDISIETVKTLLADYKFFLYSTKRHTEEVNRFRIVIPLNYQLKLDAENYKGFIDNVLAWLPFPCDESTNQRSKKWLSHKKGVHFYNEGELLDALPFIPKISRNEQFKAGFKEVQNMDNLERWFAQRIAMGNRNKQMHRFAMALVDSGLPFDEVRTRVLDFNNKLSNKLSDSELQSTVLVTVAKTYQP